MAIAAPASTTASTLARPSRPATTEGRPNTPLPITEFATSATRLQRPIARTKPSLENFWLESLSCRVPVTASLYHKSIRGFTGGGSQAERRSTLARDGDLRTDGECTNGRRRKLQKSEIALFASPDFGAADASKALSSADSNHGDRGADQSNARNYQSACPWDIY